MRIASLRSGSNRWSYLSSPPVRHPGLASAGLLGLVAVIRLWLQWVGPLPGDRYAAARYATQGNEGDMVRCLTSFFSSLGTPVIAVVLVCGALVVLWLFADAQTAYGLILACFVVPVNALLKLLSGPTPLWSEMHRVGVNFPSGHVAFVTSVVGYLGWVAARHRRPVGLLAALLIVIGMGPERVLVGAHLVSDVIAAYLVGAAVLVLAVAVADSQADESGQSG
jgi:membrane-associated phospholipid phosphatase